MKPSIGNILLLCLTVLVSMTLRVDAQPDTPDDRYNLRHGYNPAEKFKVAAERNLNDVCVDKQPVEIKLLDSNGGPLEGGEVRYRIGYGSKILLDSTDRCGTVYAFLDGAQKDFKFTMTYNGASVEMGQNIQNDNEVVFQTKKVTASLKDSSGTAIADGVSFKYRYGYGSYIDLVASGTELLPVNTKVQVSYGGTSVEKEQDVKNDAVFDEFATVKVTASLKDSSGTVITDGVSFKYRYGYGSYKDLVASGTELLPVNTKVQVSYGGTSVEKEQDIKNDAVFDEFATVKVTASLKDSSGTAIADGVSFKYCYGYGSYKDLVASGTELLPVNTKVQVSYGGTSVEKEQDIKNDAVFDEFATVKVTASLKDSSGTAIADGVSFKYRYGFGSYKDLVASGTELLPVNTKVQVSYGGTSVEKEQDVKNDAVFDEFATVKVMAEDCTTYRYGYGGYLDISNEVVQLLPGKTAKFYPGEKLLTPSTSSDKDTLLLSPLHIRHFNCMQPLRYTLIRNQKPQRGTMKKKESKAGPSKEHNEKIAQAQLRVSLQQVLAYIIYLDLSLASGFFFAVSENWQSQNLMTILSDGHSQNSDEPMARKFDESGVGDLKLLNSSTGRIVHRHPRNFMGSLSSTIRSYIPLIPSKSLVAIFVTSKPENSTARWDIYSVRKNGILNSHR
eukprot:scaffold9129_cov150-Amphora_coffeaeformis.AAC.3